MTKKLYHPGHYAVVGAHYAAAAGLLAGAVAVAPIALVAGAAVLVGGLQYGITRLQKDFFETKMKRHDSVYDYAPELGEMARELYQKSGLKSDDYPIYDLTVDQDKMAAEKLTATGKRSGFKHGLNQGLAMLMNRMAETPNAAAVRVGKPVIMISTPLLKLLDSAEEKAVLAHEFAHAAARHHHVRSPLGFALGVVGVTATAMGIGAFFAAGWVGAPLAIVAAMATGAAVYTGQAVLKNRLDLVPKDKKDMSLQDLHAHKQMMGGVKLGRAAAIVGVASAFNPIYAVVYAIEKTVNTCNKLMSARLSRHQEFQADRGAVVLGADPLALVTALRKITIVSERSTREAFDGELPKKGLLSKVWKKATATHPSLPDRTKRLVSMARQQNRSDAEITAATTAPIEIAAEHTMSPATIRAIMAR